MNGLNKIFILGYLGSDPKMQEAKSGTQYASLNIATHRMVSLGEGEQQKQTDWHFVRVWGRQAETCTKYLSKGSPVFVEGYMTQYSVPKPDGSSERRTGIQALNVSFIPTRSGNTEEIVIQ